jgi:hypothetical protein
MPGRKFDLAELVIEPGSQFGISAEKEIDDSD